MNNDRDLMQEALDALTYIGDKEIYSDTIDALRARLAQPEPEPVDKQGAPCKEFWDWLPKAYRDGDKGDEKKFTKYNMEVAYLAGKQSQPEQEPVAWLYTNKLGGRQVSLIEPLPDLKEQYQPLYTVPPQANAFNPDWDALPVMVEEQQRMAKRIEELEAQLGEAMWGYGEWRRKAEISSALCTRQGIRLMEYESQETQKPVAWGIANTRPTEKQPLMMVMLDEPEPSHLVVPLYTASPQREWQGLTEDDHEDFCKRSNLHPRIAQTLAEFIEAKLKEKNT